MGLNYLMLLVINGNDTTILFVLARGGLQIEVHEISFGLEIRFPAAHSVTRNELHSESVSSTKRTKLKKAFLSSGSHPACISPLLLTLKIGKKSLGWCCESSARLNLYLVGIGLGDFCVVSERLFSLASLARLFH